LAIPLLALALHVYLAWSYRSVYRSLLAVRAVPTVA
jgi:hypothetical protein